MIDGGSAKTPYIAALPAIARLAANPTERLSFPRYLGFGLSDDCSDAHTIWLGKVDESRSDQGFVRRHDVTLHSQISTDAKVLGIACLAASPPVKHVHVISN